MGTDAILTLSGSQSGWRYQLYKDNVPVGSPKDGTGSALTFSETSTGVGRFNYTVRTVDATGVQCEIQVSNVLVITVNAVATTTPTYAASTKTWTVGGQIWSDVINIPACDHDAFTNSTTESYCRSYTAGGKKWYYYNWTYVNANKNTLCPSSSLWRLPMMNDFIALDKFFSGTGSYRTGVAYSWISDHYYNVWGGDMTGFVNGGANMQMDAGSYWTSDTNGTASAYYLCYTLSGMVHPDRSDSRSYGFPVRCVR
jgi:uncharacterized protein (TIGR02145 family)